MIEEASEAAKHAPDHLQEAAFNKAFEALMAAQEAGKSTKTQLRSRGDQKAPNKRTSADSNMEEDTLDQLDRTVHPDIYYEDSALNNSLRLLRAAKDDLGIDGISVPKQFRNRLTKYYGDLKQAYVRGDFDVCGSRSGKFAAFRAFLRGTTQHLASN